jgi:hypothetical protein
MALACAGPPRTIPAEARLRKDGLRHRDCALARVTLALAVARATLTGFEPDEFTEKTRALLRRLKVVGIIRADLPAAMRDDDNGR